jgi:trimethylamine--corrinoid protein Co-methyltransferase
MLVMQHELIGYVERVMRGIGLDADDIAFDVVKEVGPGGAFIAHEHTAAHFRKELWFPRLLDREFYDAWRSAGAHTMADRCRQEKERRLASHEVAPLPDDVAGELDRIAAAARRDLGT